VYAIGTDIGVIGSVGFGGVAGVWGEISGPAGSGLAGNASDVGGIGVIGMSKAGPAIAAQSELDGVTLELTPAERAGPPTAMPTGLSEYRVGALSVDADREVWLCTETGAPESGPGCSARTRLSADDPDHTDPSARHPRDGRSSRGRAGRARQRKGPLHGGDSVTLDLAGVGAIPSTASGVVGNATVVTPDGGGFLRILPAGASVPASSFNFTDGVTVANGFTCGLTPPDSARSPPSARRSATTSSSTSPPTSPRRVGQKPRSSCFNAVSTARLLATTSERSGSPAAGGSAPRSCRRW
jgi:hypothetical protein